MRLQYGRYGSCLNTSALDAEECYIELETRLKDTVWEAERRVKDIQGPVWTLQKESTRLREDMPKVEARLQQLLQANGLVQSEVNSTAAQVANKDRELHQLEAQIKQLGKQISEAEAQRRGREEQNQSANAELEGLKMEVGALRNEAQDLEKRVALQQQSEPSVNELRAMEEIQAQRQRHEGLNGELNQLRVQKHTFWPSQ